MNYELAKKRITDILDEITAEYKKYEGKPVSAKVIVDNLFFKDRMFDTAKLLINGLYGNDFPSEKEKFIKGINKLYEQSTTTSAHIDYARQLGGYLKTRVLYDIDLKQELDKSYKDNQEAFKQLTSSHRKLQDELSELQQQINNKNSEINRLTGEKRVRSESTGRYFTQFLDEAKEDKRIDTLTRERDQAQEKLKKVEKEIGVLTEASKAHFEVLKSEIEKYNELVDVVEQKNQMIEAISWQRDEAKKELEELKEAKTTIEAKLTTAEDELTSSRNQVSTLESKVKEVESSRYATSQVNYYTKLENEKLKKELAERPDRNKYLLITIINYILIFVAASTANIYFSTMKGTETKFIVGVELLLVVAILTFHFRKFLTKKLSMQLFKDNDLHGRMILFFYTDKSRNYIKEDVAKHFTEFDEIKVSLMLEKLVDDKIISLKDERYYTILQSGITYIEGHIKTYQTNLNYVINIFLRLAPVISGICAGWVFLYHSYFNTKDIQQVKKETPTTLDSLQQHKDTQR